MKKNFLSLLVSFTGIMIVSAQPSTGFETWTTNGNNGGFTNVPEEPTGWISENQLATPFTSGNDTSVWKASGANAHSGLYAMEIRTVNVTNNPVPSEIPNPSGIAFTGKIQVTLSPFSIKIFKGYASTARPDSADFWYMYQPMPNDSAVCNVIVSKWNTVSNSQDTIATGSFPITTAAASYTYASFGLTYNPAFNSFTTPDTIFIYFSATCWATLNCGTVGSTLWVDDFAFSGTNGSGISELSSSSDVMIYPNPATNHVNVIADVNEASSVIAYDATGRMVSSAVLSQTVNGANRKSGVMTTSHLSSGLYSYSIIDKNKSILRCGKFNIVK